MNKQALVVICAIFLIVVGIFVSSEYYPQIRVIQGLLFFETLSIGGAILCLFLGVKLVVALILLFWILISIVPFVADSILAVAIMAVILCTVGIILCGVTKVIELLKYLLVAAFRFLLQKTLFRKRGQNEYNFWAVYYQVREDFAYREFKNSMKPFR